MLHVLQVLHVLHVLHVCYMCHVPSLLARRLSAHLDSPFDKQLTRDT
jgi:hypothetical protein